LLVQSVVKQLDQLYAADNSEGEKQERRNSDDAATTVDITSQKHQLSEDDRIEVTIKEY
jgi:hypothetical protein